MNGRKLTTLTAITGVLAVGEFGSAVNIGLGKDPWGAGFAVAFGLLFALATWLLRRGRVTGGAVFCGVLCLFEIIEFPSWHKHGVLDWAFDSAFAVASVAGLIAAGRDAGPPAPAVPGAGGVPAGVPPGGHHRGQWRASLAVRRGPAAVARRDRGRHPQPRTV